MKYMISWSERSQGSPIEYENAQKRILEVFTQWKAPDNFKIEMFVIRVGDWGGYMRNRNTDQPRRANQMTVSVSRFACELFTAFRRHASRWTSTACRAESLRKPAKPDGRACCRSANTRS